LDGFTYKIEKNKMVGGGFMYNIDTILFPWLHYPLQWSRLILHVSWLHGALQQLQQQRQLQYQPQVKLIQLPLLPKLSVPEAAPRRSASDAGSGSPVSGSVSAKPMTATDPKQGYSLFPQSPRPTRPRRGTTA